MSDIPDILRLRVLLAFLKEDRETCTITGISRTLGEEKYKISRIVIGLEKDGLIDRSDQRHPVLTKVGKKTAEQCAERIRISLSHLLYEGVDLENARNDAFIWALYCSDKTMETVRATEARYRVKYELRGQKQFNGATLCRRLGDGTYQFPFLIYREHVRNGSNISMGNEGFEHPCVLHVENGVGMIQLRAVAISANSGLNGALMRGKVKSLKYFDSGIFSSAEQSGDIFQFPASVLHFVNVGSGVGQILHGSVCIRLESSVGMIHMPESTAIFTLLI